MRDLARVARNAIALIVVGAMALWFAWLLVMMPVQHWLTRDERAAAQAEHDRAAQQASERARERAKERSEELKRLGPAAVQIIVSDRRDWRVWDVVILGDRWPLVRVRASCFGLLGIQIEGPGDDDARPGASAVISLSPHHSLLGSAAENAAAMRLGEALLEAVAWRAACPPQGATVR